MSEQSVGLRPGRRRTTDQAARIGAVLVAALGLSVGLAALYDQTLGTRQPELPAETQQVIDQINAVRAKASCPPVTVNASLTAMAQAHAADMVTRGYLSNVNLDNQDAASRAHRFGYTGAVTQSFAAGLATPTEVVTQMTNPGNDFAKPVLARIRACPMVSIGIGHDTGATRPSLAAHVWVIALGGP
jgi:hypothetical protein